MENVFARLKEEIESTVKTELETFYRMSGMFISTNKVHIGVFI